MSSLERNALLAALRSSALSEWTLVEQVDERAVLEVGGPTRAEQATRFVVIAHADTPAGRGSARLELDAGVALSAAEAVNAVRAAARADVGQAWKSAPPSAPARVMLADPALAHGDLARTLAEHVDALARPDGVDVTIRLTGERRTTTVETRQGFHATWPSTRARAELAVATAAHAFEVEREARRLGDLAIAAALADATHAAALADAVDAQPLLAPGPATLILRPDALLHGGGHGAWAVFAQMADAELEGRGLARYRVGSAIAPGADTIAEPLSITSDGALDFGLRSAPIGDDGEAVRRFPLVQRGIALGLGLSPREAALRRVEPNGGVRDLVVALGTWDERAPVVAAEGARRVVDVLRLHDLTIDPYTGEATLAIALAREQRTPNLPPRVVVGGTLRVDLVALLARARRSTRWLQRGAYRGPAAVVVDRVDLA